MTFQNKLQSLSPTWTDDTCQPWIILLTPYQNAKSQLSEYYQF